MTVFANRPYRPSPQVIERRWYDKNKHIFPASRWETYDPSKVFDAYTIYGGGEGHGAPSKK